MKQFFALLKNKNSLLSILLCCNLITAAQNVGIGTTTPVVPLEVVSSTSDTAIAQFTNNGFNNEQASVVITNKSYGSGLKVDLNGPSSNGTGIEINNKSEGIGIIANTSGTAVWGVTNGISHSAVFGLNTYGESVVGISPKGAKGSGDDPGAGAIVGRNDSSGYGVRGFSTKTGIGIVGQSGFLNSTGIAGKFFNINAANASDVLIISNIQNATGDGIVSTQRSTTGVAIRGISTGISSVAVQGEVANGAATGVKGLSTGNNGTGVIGEANTGTSAYGIWGKSTSGYAGYFSGDVHVTGNLSKAAGTFKIDHPQDPANKYLIHSFVESPDMINIYNGNIITDKNGKATVQLPGYFEAENIDFKYQLTIIDENQFAQARISKQIHNNEFVIMTDKPGIKVSWMVTGVRNDAYAKKHRVIPEVEKSKEEKGKYLNAKENDQPEELGMDYIKPVNNNTKQVVILPEETKVSRPKYASEN